MKQELHERAVRALEEHGYLFQQRCLADIRNFASGFAFESEEYPVSIGEEDTVVDFIIRSTKGATTYLLFECKRANPDYVTWLFPKAVPAGSERPKFLATKVDVSTRYSNAAWLQTVELDLLDGLAEHLVSVGLEISQKMDHQKKRGRSSRSEVIYEACQQALTGVGGLAVEHQRWMDKNDKPSLHYYVPIVATTANLILAEYRRSKIDIKTGVLLPQDAETKPVDWVVFDFPVREGIQVTVPDQSNYAVCGPSEDYRRKFKVKSVAIVKGNNIVQFLNQLKFAS